MTANLEIAGGRQGPSATDWQGRSGRHYLLSAEALDSFVMRDSALYIIASDHHVLWVGSARDLVSDAASRGRFRRAVASADQAFRLDDPPDVNAAIWDLEGAMLTGLVSAQAA